MSTPDWRDTDHLSNQGTLAAIRDFESVYQDNEGVAPEYYMNEELDHVEIEKKLNKARERARERRRIEKRKLKTRVPFASVRESAEKLSISIFRRRLRFKG